MTDTTHANQNIKYYFLMLKKAVSKQEDQQRKFRKGKSGDFINERFLSLYPLNSL